MNAGHVVRCKSFAKEYEKCIEALRRYVAEHPLSEEEKREQRINFAYGNVSLHNPEVTLELVQRVADEMEKKNDD